MSREPQTTRSLTVFNQISLDGYFSDANGDMSWAHKNDPEWREFTTSNARGGGALVLGRVTYELMAAYWPTPQARQDHPLVAESMTRTPKIVFSRSMRQPEWQNTMVIRDDIVASMQRLKTEPGPDMVILGSGTIVSQFAQAGLIDTFQLVMNPIVLGKGRTLFEGVRRPIHLELQSARSFSNGNTVLTYRTRSAHPN